MPQVITGETQAHTWEKSLRLFTEGDWDNQYASSRGHCFECTNVILEIRNPEKEPKISDHYAFSEEVISNFENQASSETSDINTIHNRIRDWDSVNGDPIDQLDRVAELLRDDPQTRKGVVSIWDPGKDLQSAVPMAPLTLHFTIRQEKVWLSSVSRSVDAWLGAPPDLFSFVSLQEKLAERLEIPVGGHNYHVMSYHVYDLDLPIITEMNEGL